MIFFVHILVDWSFKFANKLSCRRDATFCYLVCFYFFTATFVLVWFCEPSHDLINIDTVTVYVLPHACHCLWKYCISELSIVHESTVWPFQSLFILTDINDPFETNSEETCFQQTPRIKRTLAWVLRVST